MKTEPQARKLSIATGQKSSVIVTPNGRTSTFTEDGVVNVGTVSNKLDRSHKQALIRLFGEKSDD